MIRQAISCDICGAEKRQTNHWFVAWEQADELRVSGWNSRNRLRAGAKHLCGQVCLHKLADDFMARVIAQKSSSKTQAADELEPSAIPAANAISAAAVSPASRVAAARVAATPAAMNSSHAVLRSSIDTSLTDTSLTSSASSADLDSAQLDSSVRLPSVAQATEGAGLVTMRERPHPEAPPPPVDEPPRFASRNWRVEAWQRERERTQRPEIVTRRIGAGD